MFPSLRTARVAVAAVFFSSGAGFATWAARIPAVRERLDLSPGELGGALLGLTGGAFAALLLAGALVARWGSRTTSAAALAVFCAALPLPAFAPSLPLLAGALALVGGANSVLDVAMNAHGVRVEHAYDRPILAGFHGWWSLGGVAGAAAGAAAAGARVDVRLHFAVAAAVLALVGLAAVSRFLRGPDGERAGPSFARPTRGLLVLGAVAFCGLLAEGAAGDWGAVYLRQVTGSDPGVAAGGYAVFAGCMAAGRLVADRVVARTGAAWFVRGAGLLGTVGVALALAVAVPAVGIVGFALLGVGLAGIVPIVFSAAGRIQPDAPGSAIAGVSTLGYLGLLTGPALIGGVAQLTDLRLGLAAVAVLTAVMAGLARHVHQGERGERTSGPAQAPVTEP